MSTPPDWDAVYVRTRHDGTAYEVRHPVAAWGRDGDDGRPIGYIDSDGRTPPRLRFPETDEDFAGYAPGAPGTGWPASSTRTTRAGASCWS